MTVVELVRRECATLHVRGLDAYDGTPVLDLKPYVPRFDRIEGTESPPEPATLHAFRTCVHSIRSLS